MKKILEIINILLNKIFTHKNLKTILKQILIFTLIYFSLKNNDSPIFLINMIETILFIYLYYVFFYVLKKQLEYENKLRKESLK